MMAALGAFTGVIFSAIIFAGGFWVGRMFGRSERNLNP